jgi:hypothetical protein
MQQRMIVNLSSLGIDSLFSTYSDIYKKYVPKETVRKELYLIKQASLDWLTKNPILTFACSVCTKDTDVAN